MIHLARFLVGSLVMGVIALVLYLVSLAVGWIGEIAVVIIVIVPLVAYGIGSLLVQRMDEPDNPTW